LKRYWLHAVLRPHYIVVVMANTRQFNVRLPEPLFEALSNKAETDYTTVSALLREAVVQMLRKDAAAKP
jgi:hypothetical protein